ncbi:hypothetical protein ACOSQ3_012203 [Xanthoceras sorbifolium]
MKPEASNTIPPRQRSANYKPTLIRAAELKEKVVKLMFAKSVEVLAKLEIIDMLMKLGLSILLEKQSLDSIAASIKIHNHSIEQDLYSTALCFRLLRHHGYEISQDIFKGFMDENGTFSKSKCRDIKGLIELFEASHLALEGENILDEAKCFSNGILKEAYSTLDVNLQRKYGSKSKWNINMYEKNKDMNTILLELAKLNFNMVQATHQNELKEVSSEKVTFLCYCEIMWWKNLGLSGKLNFTRDQVIESYVTGLGLVSDPKQTYLKPSTKAIALVIVIDDIYDVYGSLEELQHLTNAVDGLVLYIKTFFQALYDIINEMAYEIEDEKGWNQVLPYLEKMWADHTKALLMEAKWYNEGYAPSLQEYLGIGWITSGCLVLGVHSFFSIMNEVSDEMEHFLETNQQIMYDPCTIVRLWNDLSTSKIRKPTFLLLCCQTHLVARELNFVPDLAGWFTGYKSKEIVEFEDKGVAIHTVLENYNTVEQVLEPGGSVDEEKFIGLNVVDVGVGVFCYHCWVRSCEEGVLHLNQREKYMLVVVVLLASEIAESIKCVCMCRLFKDTALSSQQGFRDPQQLSPLSAAPSPSSHAPLLSTIDLAPSDHAPAAAAPPDHDPTAAAPPLSLSDDHATFAPPSFFDHGPGGSFDSSSAPAVSPLPKPIAVSHNSSPAAVSTLPQHAAVSPEYSQLVHSPMSAPASASLSPAPAPVDSSTLLPEPNFDSVLTSWFTGYKSKVLNQLEAEKKRAEELTQMRKASQSVGVDVFGCHCWIRSCEEGGLNVKAEKIHKSSLLLLCCQTHLVAREPNFDPVLSSWFTGYKSNEIVKFEDKVLNQLEAEKKRGEELTQMRKASQRQCWWEAPIDELNQPSLNFICSE